MKSLGIIAGLSIGLVACGSGAAREDGAEARGLTAGDAAPGSGLAVWDLRSDADLELRAVQVWHDLMPNGGFGRSGRIRSEVRLVADTKGCTRAGDFFARLIQEDGRQTLVIKRLKADTCTGVAGRTEVTVPLSDAYQAGVPVWFNGTEVPVAESYVH